MHMIYETYRSDIHEVFGFVMPIPESCREPFMLVSSHVHHLHTIYTSFVYELCLMNNHTMRL